jgi:hypothetical protein
MTASRDPKPPVTLRRHDIEWIEIGAAARFSRTKRIAIGAAITAGTLDVLAEQGKIFIRMSAAHRLKRESGAMRATERNSAIGDMVPAANIRRGPHAARERQDVLPMSSGRSGRGWLGQKPPTRSP